MVMEIQKAPVVPNAVYVPQIVIQTSAVAGRLVTSANVSLSSAAVDPDGKWTPAGHNGMVYIPDIENLDSDLSGLGPDMRAAFALIVSLIQRVNEIRKVV